MRKYLTLILVIVTVATSAFSSYFCYTRGVSDGEEKAIRQYEVEVMGKIDYPLIDIYFDDDSEWLIINTESTGEEKDFIDVYSIIENPLDIRYNTEELRVITFPVGLGITGEGSITVYRNGEEFKYVPYVEYMYTSQLMKDSFVEVSQEYIEGILGFELPGDMFG